MKPRLRILAFLLGLGAAVISSATLLSSCVGFFRYSGPCSAPRQFASKEVIGQWQTVYDAYQSSDYVPYSRDPLVAMSEPPKHADAISGIDILTFYDDGTYNQVFKGDDFVYKSSSLRWELNLNGPEGPKLRMYGLKYFAFGISNAEGPLYLQPQNPDQLRYQREQGELTSLDEIIIAYPYDGYLFLYPRSCLGKTVLLQMVGINCCDPDDLSVHHPVFEKVD